VCLGNPAAHSVLSNCRPCAHPHSRYSQIQLPISCTHGTFQHTGQQQACAHLCTRAQVNAAQAGQPAVPAGAAAARGASVRVGLPSRTAPGGGEYTVSVVRSEELGNWPPCGLMGRHPPPCLPTLHPAPATTNCCIPSLCPADKHVSVRCSARLGKSTPSIL